MTTTPIGRIPYVRTSERVAEKDPTREVLRVRIDPQFYEIVLDPATLYNRAGQMNMPPHEALRIIMIDLLRDQARAAYDAVMGGGLSALAGRAMGRDEIDKELRHYVEEAARAVERSDAEAKQWKDLAARRSIEINALERAIARRQDS